MSKVFIVGEHAVAVSGYLPRVARLRDEFYDFVHDPVDFLTHLKAAGAPGNIFTFVQRVSDRHPRYDYHLEWDSIAVLKLSTYEAWWNEQINCKARNMVRKAEKCGITVRLEPFSDALVDGIARIYNETPIRQGRRFKHYGKSLSTIKEDHATFLDRSDFLCAYSQGELVGFIKLVHNEGASNLMQIISMHQHRDKAVTDVLIARAVERCTSRGVPMLQYGSWSRRNMEHFKKHRAFERVEIPRYYVPLNTAGAIILRLGLHRSLRSRLPGPWLDQLALVRSKCNALRFQSPAGAAR